MYRLTTAADREDADARHGEAMVALLDAIVRYAMAPGITLTVREAEQRRDQALNTMEALSRDLVDFDGFNLRQPTAVMEDISADMEDISAVANAILVYRRLVEDRFQAEMKIATKNASNRHQDRWLVLKIAKVLERLYGKRLYGNTAAIVSELTGRKIKKSAVRYWAGPPKNTARKLIPAAGMRKKPRRGASAHRKPGG